MNAPAVPANEADRRILVESRLRSVIKAISWRIIGTMDTFCVSFIVMRFVGGQESDNMHLAKLSGGIAGTEVFTKIMLYYFHERAWAQVPLGTIRRWSRWFDRSESGKD